MYMMQITKLKKMEKINKIYGGIYDTNGGGAAGHYNAANAGGGGA